MSELLNDLRTEIKKKNVLIVVGAGVSIGATNGNPVTSWTGLLKSGFARCLDLQLPLPAGWADRVRGEIESGDVSELLSAANKISDKLGYPDGPEYGRWLREKFESLAVVDESLIKTLISFALPIATTNYDTLIENVTGFPSVTWKDNSLAQRVLRGDKKGILHLHGVWSEPDSIILGIRAYEEILKNEFMQHVLRSCLFFKSLLFVGFGAGLQDPNFSSLRRWSRKVLSGSQYRHYRLVLKCEEEKVRREHDEERIWPLSFGKGHADLVPFLKKLCPRSPTLASCCREIGNQLYP